MLAEERLGQPARAARLYAEVALRYPRSRVARRSRLRAELLTESLASGEAPLREYQEILSHYAERPPSASIARMERLLASYPGFARADHARYWIGAAYLEQGRYAEAERWFLETERLHPHSIWAARAKKGRAELALRRGQLNEARRLSRELTGADDPGVRAAGREGLTEVRKAATRRALAFLSGAYLIAFLIARGLQLRGARRGAVPVEALYYTPIAVLFVLAAATENRAIALATLVIALGGGGVLWLAARAVQARLEVGPLRLGQRLAHALSAGLAALAVAYLAIHYAGLVDLVVETFRLGPER